MTMRDDNDLLRAAQDDGYDDGLMWWSVALYSFMVFGLGLAVGVWL